MRLIQALPGQQDQKPGNADGHSGAPGQTGLNPGHGKNNGPPEGTPPEGVPDIPDGGEESDNPS